MPVHQIQWSVRSHNIAKMKLLLSTYCLLCLNFLHSQPNRTSNLLLEPTCMPPLQTLWQMFQCVPTPVQHTPQTFP